MDDECYSDDSHNSDNESKESESELLHWASYEMEYEMSRYTEMLEYLWNEKVIPFIESTDCNILERLTRNDYRKFCKMMYKQPIYRKMVENYKKINRKLAVLSVDVSD